jgi:hypothetical protein
LVGTRTHITGQEQHAFDRLKPVLLTGKGRAEQYCKRPDLAWAILNPNKSIAPGFATSKAHGPQTPQGTEVSLLHVVDNLPAPAFTHRFR